MFTLFEEPPNDRGSVFLLIDPRRPSGTAFDPRKGRMRICVNSFQGNSPIFIIFFFFAFLFLFLSDALYSYDGVHSSESQYLSTFTYIITRQFANRATEIERGVVSPPLPISTSLRISWPKK